MKTTIVGALILFTGVSGSAAQGATTVNADCNGSGIEDAINAHRSAELLVLDITGTCYNSTTSIRHPNVIIKAAEPRGAKLLGRLWFSGREAKLINLDVKSSLTVNGTELEVRGSIIRSRGTTAISVYGNGHVRLSQGTEVRSDLTAISLRQDSALRVVRGSKVVSKLGGANPPHAAIVAEDRLKIVIDQSYVRQTVGSSNTPGTAITLATNSQLQGNNARIIGATRLDDHSSSILTYSKLTGLLRLENSSTATLGRSSTHTGSIEADKLGLIEIRGDVGRIQSNIACGSTGFVKGALAGLSIIGCLSL